MKTKNDKWLLVACGCFVLILCLIVAILLLFSLGLFGLNKLVDNVGQFSDGIDKQEFENPSPAGTTLTVSGLVFKVIEVKDLGSVLKSTYTKPPGLRDEDLGNSEIYDDCVSDDGKFISVKYSVKNDSTQAISATGLSVYDIDGKKYSAATEILNCKTSSVIFQNINPGLETTFEEVYEIPKSVKGLRLEVKDYSLFGIDKKYILLGL